MLSGLGFDYGLSSPDFKTAYDETKSFWVNDRKSFWKTIPDKPE